MLDIFTQHWDFWINAIAALTGLIGLVWSIRTSSQSTSKKVIGYRVISNASLVDFHTDLDQEVEVILKPKLAYNTAQLSQAQEEEVMVVNNARLLIIEVRNMGNTVITRSDITLSRFRFEKGKVLLCGVQDQYVYPPNALQRISNGLHIDKDKASVEFMPEYFNKGDRANIKVMVSEDVPFRPEFDIQDGEAREIKQDQPQLTRRMILIGSTGLLGGLIVAGAIRPISTFVQGQCAVGSIILGGSSAFLPTANEAINEYSNTCAVGPIVADIRPVTADSTKGIEQLLGKQIQIACAELPRQDVEQMAEKNKLQIEANPVGLVVFALIIHGETGIKNLTLQNIQDIYSGQIKDWKELGGKPGRIYLLGRNPGSGTRRSFERFIFPGSYGTVIEASSTDKMYESVINNPGAIGYIDLKTAQARSSSGKATILTIEGQEASTDNAAKEKYSFCAMEYLYTLQNPGTLVSSFIKQVKAKVAENTFYYVPYDKLSPTLQKKYE